MLGDFVQLLVQGSLRRDGVAKSCAHLRRETGPEESQLTIWAQTLAIGQLEKVCPRCTPCPKFPEREIGRELSWRWSRRRAAWWGAGWPRSGGSIRRLCKLLLQSGGSVLMAFFLLVKLREKSREVPFGSLRLGSGGFDLRLCRRRGHKRRQPFRELGSGLTIASHKKRIVEQGTIQKWW